MLQFLKQFRNCNPCVLQILKLRSCNPCVLQFLKENRNCNPCVLQFLTSLNKMQHTGIAISHYFLKLLPLCAAIPIFFRNCSTQGLQFLNNLRICSTQRFQLLVVLEIAAHRAVRQEGGRAEQLQTPSCTPLNLILHRHYFRRHFYNSIT